jgi:hypothetical protein
MIVFKGWFLLIKFLLLQTVDILGLWKINGYSLNRDDKN